MLPKSLYRLAISLVLIISIPARASANCSMPTKDIESYLKANGDWKLVTVEDLIPENKLLWERYHKEVCPGVAAANLDASGVSSYAIALIRRLGSSNVEKLVLLRHQSGHLQELLLNQPMPVPIPLVVWRTGPGKFHDYGTGKTVKLGHDSIIYEQMESSGLQYYLSGGKIRSLVASE
jgi:hypothetical protein